MTYLLMIKTWNQAAGIKKQTALQADAANLITNRQCYRVNMIFWQGFCGIDFDLNF